jgi:mRNA interferase MazF
MAYQQGDVILVPFPFTDLSASRVRPAVVVSTAAYSSSGDLIVAMITSRPQTRQTDYELRDWDAAGLLAPSWARAKIATLHEGLVRYSPGTLSLRDKRGVEKRIRLALGL